MGRLLIADDDRDTCRYIQRHLAMEQELSAQFDEIDVVHDRDSALELLAARSYTLIILDLWMPGKNGQVDREAGMKILERARECQPPPEAILITGHSSLDSVLRASGLGVIDYVLRPIDYEHLLDLIRQGIEQHALHAPGQDLQEVLFDGQVFIGRSQAMMDLMKDVGRIAHSGADVLLVGESGTGKDMLAWAIHRNGPQRDTPFVTVNCSAIPVELLEAELFGIQSRVATEVDARAGKFVEADGGTLFLDEIGELNLAMQPKLLRALDSKEIQPVGGKTRHVDVRIIAATNRDLRVAVGEGDFRADLYFRLSGVAIHLPPLRDRQEDIEPLTEHFLAHYRQEFKKRFVREIAPETWALFRSYRWPGNVRELERAIKYAVATCNRKQITPDNLPSEITELSQNAEQPDGSLTELIQVEGLKNALSRFERVYIEHHLQRNGWNVKQTAAEIGIARQVLHRKIRRYDLHR